MIIGTAGTRLLDNLQFRSLQFFKVGEIMVSKYGNFTNEVIGQSYVPVVKILF